MATVMRHLTHWRGRLSTFVQNYFDTLSEAFRDINDYIDTQLESETAEIIIIGIIIATPIAGTFIFIQILSVSF